MKVSAKVDGRWRDFSVENLGKSTVADLARLCGLEPEAGSASIVELFIDGHPYPAETPLSLVPLASGSTVESASRPPLTATETKPRAEPVAVVQQVAGWSSGSSIAVPAGDYALGEATETSEQSFASGHVETVRTWLRITRSGVQCRSADNNVSLVDGKRPNEVADSHNALVRSGACGFIVTDLTPAVPARPGPIVVNRPPRVTPAAAMLDIRIPQAPGSARGKQALSWASMLAPIPIGIVMAVVWSPIFALFVLMSPIMFLAQYWESGAESKKDGRRFNRETSEALKKLEGERDHILQRETRRRRYTYPSTAELRDWAKLGSPRLWERRRSAPDALRLVVGYADHYVHLNVTEGGDFAEAKELVGTAQTLPDVPVVTDLAADRAVGIVGPRPQALALARSLISQACTLHGPADLSLALVTTDTSSEDWDWSKWLPHLVAPQGLRLATDAERAAELLTVDDAHTADRPFNLIDDEPQVEGPAMLAVVDNAELLTHPTSPVRAALTRPSTPISAIIIAEDASNLPASCGLVVTISPAGRTEAHHPETAHTIPNVLPAGLSLEMAEEWSRSLSRYADPEATGGSAQIKSHVTLSELLPSTDPAEILERWRNAPNDPTPAGPVGVTEMGPLTIDLAQDGPHGLVAGTTGSGKSELLRTMVASMAAEVDPDHLNFVLIDFKGGGAFDVCAGLPHVVSVVTDLDDHLAERALRCLKAELRLREELLRDHQATDLGEYLATATEPLPRLVVIIDEFATLAVELPDFLDSLVDIAQRGRSLGVHMILATQRPAGVLDAKVKANTNLRIALRVQDDSDSDDVIGTTQATKLSRSQPGRAFVRFGQSEIMEFQTALVTGNHVPEAERLPTADLFSLALALDPVSAPDEAPEDTTDFQVEPETDIAVLVRAIREAWRLGGYQEPRVPWPDPLPTSLSIGAIRATAATQTTPATGASTPDPSEANSLAGDTPLEIPFGLMDLPDRQTQITLNWTPAVGNMLLYGIDAEDITHTMITVALGLAERFTAREFHLYGFEFGSVGLNRLSDLPHCGSIVSGSDLERTMRAIGLFEDELEERRTAVLQGLAAEELPLLMILIDNYAGLAESLEEAGELEVISHLTQVIRDGPSVGMYTLLGANHERAIPMRVANLVESKLLFRLVDHSAYGSFGLRPKDVPTLEPGRVVDPNNGEMAQLARVNNGDIAAAVAAIRGASTPPEDPYDPLLPIPVRTLPTDIPVEALDAAAAELTSARWAFPIAVRASDLTTACLGMASGEHSLIVGGAASGRSTTLATIAAVARELDADLAIIGIAPRRSVLRRSAALTALIGQHTAPGRVQELINQPRVLVLVDDASAVSPDFGRILEKVASTYEEERHIVAACRPDYARDYDAWVSPLRTAQSGLALRPSPNDGDAFRSMLPIHRPEKYPDGRAFLLQSGVPDLVQVAYSSPDAHGPERSEETEPLNPSIAIDDEPSQRSEFFTETPPSPERSQSDTGGDIDDLWGDFFDEDSDSGADHNDEYGHGPTAGNSLP